MRAQSAFWKPLRHPQATVNTRPTIGLSPAYSPSRRGSAQTTRNKQCLRSRCAAQDYGISEEGSFRTGPAPGSDETVKLLAIADLGFCEEDGSMTYAGNYPNPITTLPVGTAAEIRQEVGFLSTQNMLNLTKVPPGCCRAARIDLLTP